MLIRLKAKQFLIIVSYSNNCHSHVARALNNLQFKQITYWNTVVLICYMIRYGQFVR